MSHNMQFRQFQTELDVRGAASKRTICGIAVPFGVPKKIDRRLTEQFAKGSFDEQIPRPWTMRFARDHMSLGGTLIGVAKQMRSTDEGLYVELKVSETPIGDETLALARDGALRQLSVGFFALENRTLPNRIVERVKVHAPEVAIVLDGAYGDDAAITAVRRMGHYCPTCAKQIADDDQLSAEETVRQIMASVPPLPPPLLG